MTINEAQLFPLHPPPGHIKDRYRRLALIINREQLALLDPDDHDMLVVSCDWLLAQKELARGRHIVYFEFGHTVPKEQENLNTELFIRSNDWLYEDTETDPTIFGDVSLGRTFATEVSMVLMNYYRLRTALRTLIEHFGAEELCFFDFSYDINLLDRSLRKILVETVANECGIIFTDRSGEASPSDPDISEPVFIFRGHGFFARLLLSAYSFSLATVTALRCLFSPQHNRVLMLVNTNVTRPLIRHFPGGGLTPVFVGRTIPRKIPFLWQCLRKGVLLITPKTVSLSKEDRNRLREIRDTLDRILSAPATGGIGFSRAFVRRQIFDAGRFEEAAQSVRGAERILNRYRPARIVVDSVRYSQYRAYIELARAKGIPVDYIWHSPLSPQNKKLDTLGGDPRYSVPVSRCLSWGKTNKKWLDNIGAPQSRVRVGCPIGQCYTGADGLSTKPALSDKRSNNVLVLQYTFSVSDLAGLNTNMYSHFVETVRELRRHGYQNIRYKLHPGPGRWKKSYFEKIAETFGLDCKILKPEPFHECLKWADIVIGPCQSGAMFETLASGKPYHAFLLSPYSIDPSYFDGFPLLTSVGQLPEALKTDTREAGRRLLDDLYSIEEIPNPSQRLWEVLENDFVH